MRKTGCVTRKTVLYCGSGGEHIQRGLFPGCEEIRLDIDPACKPDIVADMARMPEDIGPFDFVYSCHSLEHLFPHEVGDFLAAAYRVLKPQGALVVIVPDLEDVRPTEEFVYNAEGTAPDGTVYPIPICGLDMYYGLHSELHRNPYMAHKCGFVEKTLHDAIARAGFDRVKTNREKGLFHLTGIGVKL